MHAKTPGNPRGVRVCGALPIAEPLPTAHGPHLPQQESTRWSRPWAPTGGGPEAAVCLGGEPFRDPLPPGALPRVGFLPWQTTDVGGRQGKARLPHAHRLPSGQQEGSLAEPLRLASGRGSRSPGLAASPGAGEFGWQNRP